MLLRERWWYVSSEVAPACRFYYAKGMNVDEAYVFVCYDSRTDRARFTPHTGAPSLFITLLRRLRKFLSMLDCILAFTRLTGLLSHLHYICN